MHCKYTDIKIKKMINRDTNYFTIIGEEYNCRIMCDNCEGISVDINYKNKDMSFFTVATFVDELIAAIRKDFHITNKDKPKLTTAVLTQIYLTKLLEQCAEKCALRSNADFYS